MTRETVTVRVPPTASNLVVLRTAVSGIAARDNFTLEQVDDLRMAVEEAGIQLLRRSDSDHLTMEVTATDSGVEIRLAADIRAEDPVLDETSFSWRILQALADELHVETEHGRAVIVLTKHRLLARRQEEA